MADMANTYTNDHHLLEITLSETFAGIEQLFLRTNLHTFVESPDTHLTLETTATLLVS